MLPVFFVVKKRARLACWAVVVKTHGPTGAYGYPQPFGSYRSFESTPFVVCECLLWSSVVSADGSYLVDPASSHMLVSKIKPCMSKYKPLHGETANGSLNQKLFI